MNKNILFFIIACLGLPLLGAILPWWLIPILLFVVAFFLKPGLWISFTVGLVMPCLSWMAVCYLSDSGASVPISSLLSGVLGIIQPLLTYLLTGLTIGIVSSLFCVSGQLLKDVVDK